MECEPEELQFLRLLGIYRESLHLLRAQRPLFARISAAFVLPLSSLFLAHIAISHSLFSHIDSDDSALDSAAPGSASESRLLHRLAGDWAALLLFKSAYLVALLLLSLLSTAAVVYSVASMYSAKDGLSFPRVLSVVPRVWRRLAATFLAAFLLLFGLHILFLAAFVGLVIASSVGSGLAGLLGFLLVPAYLAVLVYLSVVWHLASVVSVLEDYKGFDALRKSRALIAGKFWTATAIFVKLNIVFIAVELTFRAVVVRGARLGVGPGGRFLIGLAMLAALCAVVMLALVVQTVVYFVCKSYHHESIDKSNLSDHLEVYLGDYVPLKSRDVQMEHFTEA